MAANEMIPAGVGWHVWLVVEECLLLAGRLGIAVGRSSGVATFFVAHGEQSQCSTLVTEIRTFKKRYHLITFDLAQQPETFGAEKNICVH
jgi:hypothetical protein